MIIKSFVVEKNLKILTQYSSILIYGMNEGIKHDIKNMIKTHNQDSEIINLFEDAILKKSEIFFMHILNQSLFSKKKIFFLNDVSDKILPEIENYLEKEDIKIYLFSKTLEKKSQLRNHFEKRQNLAAIACYEDTETNLIYYIANELKDYKGLNNEIYNLIISNCNCNRKEIQGELDKIKILFQSKVIDKNKLFQILNQTTDSDFDNIRDNALMGNKKKLSSLLSSKNFLSEECFLYLNSISSRVQKLIDIKKKINNHQIENEIDKVKPPIFWKDKPVLIKQLKKLSLDRLKTIYSKINIIEVLMKKNSQLNNSILIKNLLIDITSEHMFTS